MAAPAAAPSPAMPAAMAQALLTAAAAGAPSAAEQPAGVSRGRGSGRGRGRGRRSEGDGPSSAPAEEEAAAAPNAAPNATTAADEPDNDSDGAGGDHRRGAVRPLLLQAEELLELQEREAPVRLLRAPILHVLPNVLPERARGRVRDLQPEHEGRAALHSQARHGNQAYSQDAARGQEGEGPSRANAPVAPSRAGCAHQCRPRRCPH